MNQVELNLVQVDSTWYKLDQLKIQFELIMIFLLSLKST